MNKNVRFTNNPMLIQQPGSSANKTDTKKQRPSFWTRSANKRNKNKQDCSTIQNPTTEDTSVCRRTAPRAATVVCSVGVGNGLLIAAACISTTAPVMVYAIVNTVCFFGSFFCTRPREST
jgi:hypothetical protein